MKDVVHISDVIAHNDSSVYRLFTHYSLVSSVLGLGQITCEFIGIQGVIDDCVVGKKAKKYMYDHAHSCPGENKIIVVNAASRAKHKNKKKAQGSNCMEATVQVPGTSNIYTVYGVDEDCFGVFADRIVSVRTLQSIEGDLCTIPDLSQGSQFRSLEHRPSAQLLSMAQQNSYFRYATIEPKIEQVNDTGFIDCDLSAMTSLEFGGALLGASRIFQCVGQCHTFFSKRNIDNKKWLLGYFDTNVEQHFVAKIKVSHQDIYVISSNKNDYTLLQEYVTSIQKVQTKNIVGEILHSCSLCPGFICQEIASSLEGEEYIEISSIQSIISSVKDNELLLIDRDKFGNGKFLSGYRDGILGIAQKLGIEVGSQITLEFPHGEKEMCYLTQSLTDKTGEKCCRNGSSTGPDGYQCIELNISFDESMKKRELIQDLEIGQKLTIQH